MLSDGWATDDPEEVGRGDAPAAPAGAPDRLGQPAQGRARLRAAGRGMAAALPFCDAFVSGHSLAALEQVVAAVAEERPGPTVTTWDDATADGNLRVPVPTHPAPTVRPSSVTRRSP